MKYIIAISLFFISTYANAQFTKYIVKFRNKGGTPHSLSTPSTYLSPASISRRTTYNIAIDSTDLPITPRYLDSIRSVPNVTIINTSKWLNQVAIGTTDPAAIIKINSFPFVSNTSGIAARLLPNQQSIGSDKLKFVLTNESNGNLDNGRVQLNYGNNFNQVNIHNGQFFFIKRTIL